MKIVDKISGKIQYEKMKKEIETNYGACTDDVIKFLDQYPEYTEPYLKLVFDYLHKRQESFDQSKTAYEYFKRYPSSVKMGEDILAQTENVWFCVDILRQGKIELSEQTIEAIEQTVLQYGRMETQLEMAKLNHSKGDLNKQKMFEERALELYFEDEKKISETIWGMDKEKRLRENVDIIYNYLEKKISDDGFVKDVVKEIIYEHFSAKEISDFYQTHNLPFAPYLTLDRYFDHVIKHGDINKIIEVGDMFKVRIKIDQKEKMVSRFMELVSKGNEMSKHSKETNERLIRDVLYGSYYKPKGKKQKDGKIVYDEKDNRPTYEQLREQREKAREQSALIRRQLDSIRTIS